jgi:hypothetical protein
MRAHNAMPAMPAMHAPTMQASHTANTCRIACMGHAQQAVTCTPRLRTMRVACTQSQTQQKHSVYASTPNVAPRVSSIEHNASSVEHQASPIAHRASGVEHRIESTTRIARKAHAKRSSQGPRASYARRRGCLYCRVDRREHNRHLAGRAGRAGRGQLTHHVCPTHHEPRAPHVSCAQRTTRRTCSACITLRTIHNRQCAHTTQCPQCPQCTHPQCRHHTQQTPAASHAWDMHNRQYLALRVCAPCA